LTIPTLSGWLFAKRFPQRRASRSGRALGVESLESRLLLAADLTLVNEAFHFVQPFDDQRVAIGEQSAIKNIGDETVVANLVVVRTVLSNDLIFGNEDDLYCAQQVIDLDLDPGEQVDRGISGLNQYTDYVGYKYLLAKVDPDNVVAEADETNNVATALILPGLPNLTASPGRTHGKTGKDVRVDQQIVFSDTDIQTYAGGQLTVQVLDVSGDDNTLSLKNGHTPSGQVRSNAKGKLKLDHKVIGNVVGGPGSLNPFQINFTKPVTADELRDVISAVSLNGKAGVPGVRRVQFTFAEAGSIAGFGAIKEVELVDRNGEST
jgi:hypothetical protein